MEKYFIGSAITEDNTQQETQLSPINLRDAFIGQSRSPDIVPFHMLDIVSYCAIVTSRMP